MLRRTFLKAFSALAAIPLLPSFMRREVKRVTLTYITDTVNLQDWYETVATFNSKPLVGVPAGEMWRSQSEWNRKYEGSRQYFEIITVYERVSLSRFNSIVPYKTSDPIFPWATLIKQDIEYA